MCEVPLFAILRFNATVIVELTFEQQVLKHSNFSIDASDRLDQVGKLEQRLETEIEPVKRSDSISQPMPRLAPQLIRSRRASTRIPPTSPIVMGPL